MHAFVEDALFVYDALGLTRVTLSTGQVKHNRKVVGQFMVQNGSLLVGHSVVANNRFAMTVPALKVLGVEQWHYNLTYGFSVGITSDGQPFCVDGDALVFYDTAGKERHRVALKASRKLPRIDLGPVLPVEAMPWTARVACGAGGSFVVVADGALFGGTLSAGTQPAIADAWTAPLARTQGRFHLRAGSFGAFVSAFHVAQRKAFCALIHAGTVKTEIVDSLGPVDFDGTRIAYQPAPTEVHRRPFGSDAIERIGLPEPGVGEVMADGDRLLFVTPERERIRDLVNDEIHDRGLPAAEQPNREKVRAFVAGFREAADSANLWLHLAGLRPPAWGEGPRPEWSWDEGDQSLLRIGVIGNLLARSFYDRELSPGSYSHPQHCAHCTEAAVDRLLAAIDAYDLDLIAGVALLETPLGRRWSPREPEPQPLFDKPAAGKLLRAILECVSGVSFGRPPEGLTPELVLEKLDPSTDHWSAGYVASAQKTAALLALEYFEGDALPIVIDWLLERPSGKVAANIHIYGDIAAALVTVFPATKAPLETAIARAIAGGDADKARRAESLRDVLLRIG